MEVKDGIKSFLFHCKYEKNLSEKTLKAYNTDILQFQRYLQQQHTEDLELVDKSTIKEYLQILSVNKPKTVKRKVATLKTMFSFFEYDDLISKNPFRKVKIKIKEPKELPKVMNITEVENILKISYLNEKTKLNPCVYGYFESIRSIAIIELLFASGIRVSELCNIKITDIDINSGILKVNGKGSKERIIQLCHKETLKSLKNYFDLFSKWQFQSEYLFVNRLKTKISEQSVRYLVRKYSSLASINRRITPHIFRHTFATLLLESDVDIKYIQQILGHSSIMTTQIYTHVNSEKQKEILTLKHPRRFVNISLD